MRNSWLVAISVAVQVGVANASVIDFESAPTGPWSSYTEQGVTISASGGGGQILVLQTPNGTLGLLDQNGPRKELRADIGGGATFVSIDLGDFNADSDLAFLEVFNSSGVLLASATQSLDASFEGMVTLGVSSPDISYAVFGSRAPSANGSSVFADNFTWSGGAVPEPATLTLLGLGLAGLAASRRRRQ